MSDGDDRDDPLSGVLDDLTDAGSDGSSRDDAAARDHDSVGEGSADAPDGERSGDADATDQPVDDAPLGDLAARVGERRDERASAAESELFTEQSAAEVDPDQLWEQVAGSEDGPPTDGVDAARDERVISKRSYCQGCEHFSEPPDVHCTHEGTEILEVVDLNRFRVVDCPVVREDELLGKVGDGRDDR